MREHLDKSPMFRSNPDSEGYGLSPLNFAPLAESLWHHLFDEDLLNAHLDRLERDQQPDGGWPISWEPPSEAAHIEWRGIVTLGALRTLVLMGGSARGRDSVAPASRTSLEPICSAVVRMCCARLEKDH